MDASDDDSDDDSDDASDDASDDDDDDLQCPWIELIIEADRGNRWKPGSERKLAKLMILQLCEK